MKGCPEPKKHEFLRELKEFLRQQVAKRTNTGSVDNEQSAHISTVSVGVRRTDFWLKVSAFRVNQTKFGSETERVATLSFVLLDQNKNKVLERKEWKTFREMVMPAKWVTFEFKFWTKHLPIYYFRNLRKCGKKMPRYCDVNNDKKITLSEWLNCFQAHHTPAAVETAKPASRLNMGYFSGAYCKVLFFSVESSKLKGPNPLETYLRTE